MQPHPTARVLCHDCRRKAQVIATSVIARTDGLITTITKIQTINCAYCATTWYEFVSETRTILRKANLPRAGQKNKDIVPPAV